MYLLGLLFSLSPPPAAPAAFPFTTGCNLAPNSAFERGTPTTVDQWQFDGLPGGSMAVVRHDQATGNWVQSGARSVRIQVPAPGPHNLYTEEPGKIPVVGGQQYVFSARLLSSNGEMAGLWLIEWNGPSVVQARLVANGGGTNKWETLEALVTLHTSTTTVSLRLIHHITSGSFFWDDVSFWRHEAGRRCADMRHYVIQSTPGFSMRQDPRCGPLRLDGRLNASGEFVTEYSHGVRDFTTYSGTGAPGPDLRIGIHKTVGDGLWRCFADPGELCRDEDGSNAEWGPNSLYLSMSLPVLPASSLSPTGVTPGAQPVFDWQPFTTRAIDPILGTQSEPGPATWHRTYAFLVDAVDFSSGIPAHCVPGCQSGPPPTEPQIGVKTNVLVIESEGSGFDSRGLGGGQRFERYFYVQGYGRVRERGLHNFQCTPENPAGCNGAYPACAPGETSFNTITPADFTFDMDPPVVQPGPPW